MRKLLWLSLFLLTFAVSTTSALAASGPRISAYAPNDPKGDPSIQVKSLDDPNNPYRDQYSALDRWAYENADYYMNDWNRVDIQFILQNLEKDYRASGINRVPFSWYSHVDEQGYVIPILEHMKALMQEPAETSTLEDLLVKPAMSDQRQLSGFWSVGVKDEVAYAQFQEEIAQMNASLYPSIPQWMVAQDRETYLLPDGGAVMTNYVGGTERGPEVEQRISRYDADGNLIKEIVVTSQTHWHRILFENADAVYEPYFWVYTKDGKKISRQEVKEARKKGTPINLGGSHNNYFGTGAYSILRGDTPGNILAVFDHYQGKLMTAEEYGDALKDLPLQWPYFNPISPDELLRIYKAQQAGSGQ